jgi:hypothetical protein
LNSSEDESPSNGAFGTIGNFERPGDGYITQEITDSGDDGSEGEDDAPYSIVDVKEKCDLDR